MGSQTIIEKIWDILDNYSFFTSDRDVDEYFNLITYEFYQERIERAHNVGPSYPSPENQPQIGLRTMSIEEYGDPYYLIVLPIKNSKFYCIIYLYIFDFIYIYMYILLHFIKIVKILYN